MLTVWNRTAEHAKPLLNQGTVLAPSALAAVQASPVVLVCVADYTAWRTILAAPGVADALRGKVLVQLSTGTPQDARDDWAALSGVAYLDGALLATPDQIGRPDTPLFISGEERALAACRQVLEAIAGNIQYMGEPIGNAAAWDLATRRSCFEAAACSSTALRWTTGTRRAASTMPMPMPIPHAVRLNIPGGCEEHPSPQTRFGLA